MCIVVDSSLPPSLKHIISNAEYYGPSIYLPGSHFLPVDVGGGGRMCGVVVVVGEVAGCILVNIKNQNIHS